MPVWLPVPSHTEEKHTEVTQGAKHLQVLLWGYTLIYNKTATQEGKQFKEKKGVLGNLQAISDPLVVLEIR